MGKMKYLLLLLLAGACFAQSEFNAYYTKLNSGESWESDYKQGVIVDTDGTEAYTGLTVADRTEQVAQLPLWIFHGDADEVVSVEVSRKIVKALRDAGGNPKYTEYPGVNHYSWDLAYRDPELVAWLFSQKRGAAENPTR